MRYDYVVVRVYDEDVKIMGDIDIGDYAYNLGQKEMKTRLIRWCVQNNMPSGLYCIVVKGCKSVSAMYPEYFNKR